MGSLKQINNYRLEETQIRGEVSRVAQLMWNSVRKRWIKSSNLNDQSLLESDQ